MAVALAAVLAVGLVAAFLSRAGGDDAALAAPKDVASAGGTNADRRGAFERELRVQLAGLSLDEEAIDCAADAALATWDEAQQGGTAVAQEAGTRFAEAITACTKGQTSGAAPAAGGEPVDAGEVAFLQAARSMGPSLSADDGDVVAAGRQVCSVMRLTGASLGSLLSGLVAIPAASAKLSGELASNLDATLTNEELTVFATLAVASFCPELNDL